MIYGMKINKKIMFVAADDQDRIRKGFIYFEHIVPEILEKYKNVEIIYVGKPTEWNVPVWLEKRIIQTGYVSWKKMRQYYKSCDMIVSCSLCEGFPNALLEAMAEELPIVTSDIDGIREYLTHLKSGYIFKRGDNQGLIAGISYMLDNPKKAKAMGKLSKKKVKKLDSDLYSAKLLKFVEDVNENGGLAESVNLLK